MGMWVRCRETATQDLAPAICDSSLNPDRRAKFRPCVRITISLGFLEMKNA